MLSFVVASAPKPWPCSPSHRGSSSVSSALSQSSLAVR
ncbi:unnamed protein product [Brassica rapa subsp. narinosa]